MQDQVITWREISVAPDYEVSNTGRVRNKVTGYVLKVSLRVGYPAVSLSANYFIGERYQYHVHRLAIEAFIGSAPTHLVRPQVNHIDGDKTNNNITNLEWVSHAGNAQHAYKLGLLKTPAAPLGENHSSAVLTEDQVRFIRTSSTSANRLAKDFGVSKTTVLHARNRRTWKHVV